MHFGPQRPVLLVQGANVLDSSIENLALAWLDRRAIRDDDPTVTDFRAHASLRHHQRRHSAAQLVQVCVQVLAIPPLDGRVRDALALAAAHFEVFVLVLGDKVFVVGAVFAARALEQGRVASRDGGAAMVAEFGRGDAAAEGRSLSLYYGKGLMVLLVGMQIALPAVGTQRGGWTECLWV